MYLLKIKIHFILFYIFHVNQDQIIVVFLIHGFDFDPTIISNIGCQIYDFFNYAFGVLFTNRFKNGTGSNKPV